MCLGVRIATSSIYSVSSVGDDGDILVSDGDGDIQEILYPAQLSSAAVETNQGAILILAATAADCTEQHAHTPL